MRQYFICFCSNFSDRNSGHILKEKNNMMPVSKTATKSGFVLPEVKSAHRERGLVLADPPSACTARLPTSSYPWFTDLKNIFVPRGAPNPQKALSDFRYQYGCALDAKRRGDDSAARCSAKQSYYSYTIFAATVPDARATEEDAFRHVDTCLFLKSDYHISALHAPVAQLLGSSSMWPQILLLNGQRAQSCWPIRCIGEAALYGDEQAKKFLLGILTSPTKQEPGAFAGALISVMHLWKATDAPELAELVEKIWHAPIDKHRVRTWVTMACEHPDEKSAMQAFQQVMAHPQPSEVVSFCGDMIRQKRFPTMADDAFKYVQQHVQPITYSTVVTMAAAALDPESRHQKLAREVLLSCDRDPIPTDPEDQKKAFKLIRYVRDRKAEPNFVASLQIKDAKSLEEAHALLDRPAPVFPLHEVCLHIDHDWVALLEDAGTHLSAWMRALSLLADSYDAYAAQARLLLRSGWISNDNPLVRTAARVILADVALHGELPLARAEARGLLCSWTLLLATHTADTVAAYGLYKRHLALDQTKTHALKQHLLSDTYPWALPTSIRSVVWEYMDDRHVLSWFEENRFYEELVAAGLQ
jgi:hypothetical protein